MYASSARTLASGFSQAMTGLGPRPAKALPALLLLVCGQLPVDHSTLHHLLDRHEAVRPRMIWRRRQFRVNPCLAGLGPRPLPLVMQHISATMLRPTVAGNW